MSDNDKSHRGRKPGSALSPGPPAEGKVLKFKRKAKLTPKDYTDGILAGNRSVLSQAITLIESTLPADTELAQKIISGCLPHSGKSLRIGVTGTPGVGKSTFIESFGLYLTREQKRTVAVLAIDPTSEISGGSILGDKVRMEKLSLDPDAFIRPSPSAGSLGGVAKNTRETIMLCEAAGFNTIIVETMGVGQSETAVHSMVDFFLLLLLAGAGDELQGIKRGIMEMADAIAVTKADGTNIEKAGLAKKEFQNALSLYPPHEGGWTPAVMTCSAIYNEGIEGIWETILDHHKLMEDSGRFEKKRREQAIRWMHEAVIHSLKDNFYGNEKVKDALGELEKEVVEDKISPFAAAQKLLDTYFKNLS